MSRVQLETAVGQIEFARQYTRGMLADLEESEWFAMPAGATTHVAWQVGHLAMAQYALTMLRIRGKEPEDAALIDKPFLRSFQKGSVPVADPQTYPGVDEILGTLDRVHERSLAELARYQDDDLQDPLPAPYALFPNKLGSVFFCSLHEMVHAGQIGMLRRMLGKPPLR